MTGERFLRVTALWMLGSFFFHLLIPTPVEDNPTGTLWGHLGPLAPALREHRVTRFPGTVPGRLLDTLSRPLETSDPTAALTSRDLG